MRYKIKGLLGDYSSNSGTEISGTEMIQACHRVLLELHPELKIRWARIYGFRWAYLLGNSELTSINTVRIKLNEKYGIFIDNAEILSQAELKAMTATLKECFAHGANFPQ
jgi:hypothetical protein